MNLIDKQALRVSGSRKSLLTLPLVIDPQTSRLTLRIPLPTTANPSVNFPASAKLAVSIVVDVDGVEHRVSASVTGGIHKHHVGTDREGEHEAYTLSWDLPMGYFGESSTDPMEWVNIKPKRLGETTKAPLKAWVEVERSRGAANAEFSLDCEVEEAPRFWQFHHSIAYDTQTAVASDGDADGILSTTFEASAGSNRVALVVAGVDATTGTDNSATFSYGGGAPSLGNTWNVSDGTFSRCTAATFKDSEIGSGSKTVQVTWAGASPVADGGVTLAMISLSGVDQTTPYGTAATDQGTDGTGISVTVGSVGATDLVVDGLYIWAGPGTIGADQTQRAATNAGSNYTRMSTQAGADGGVMSWGNGSGEFSYGAVAFKEAAGGGGGTANAGRMSLLGVGS